MSFRRLNKKEHDTAPELSTRLVNADDSVELEDQPLQNTSVSAAASAQGRSSSASPPSVSPAAVPTSPSALFAPSSAKDPASHGASTFSSHHYVSKALSSSGSGSASNNNPTHSSLMSGSRDMELVELHMYEEGKDGEEEEEEDERKRKKRFGGTNNGSDADSSGDRRSTAGMVNNVKPPRIWPSVLRDGWKVYLTRSLREIFLSTKLNILLLAVPAAIICRLGGWGDGPVFVFSLLGLCPLAERLSFFTDELAKYTNDTIGGLMSATLGNATELIVSLVALKNGLLRIVQLSLIGSVYSNLLLVQGTAFLVGGLKYKQQKFSQAAAKTNVSLLLLAVMALLFPMVLLSSNQVSGVTSADSLTPEGTVVTNATSSTDGMMQFEGITNGNLLILSRLTSCLLLIVYGMLILYQLKTHVHLFEGGTGSHDSSDHHADSETTEDEEEDEDDEENEPPILGPAGSLVWMGIVTIFISFLSEFIVSALDGAATSLGLPILFIATILLPIVGNAAEHASAIVFARRDQMDIALGISVGSSTQISLFVIPLLVVLGWISGHPLSLDFQVFETISLFLTVVMTSLVLGTGKSDWLYGMMMIVAYIVISMSFWLQKQPADLN